MRMLIFILTVGEVIVNKLAEPDCGVIGFGGSKVKLSSYSGWYQCGECTVNYFYQNLHNGLTAGLLIMDIIIRCWKPLCVNIWVYLYISLFTNRTLPLTAAFGLAMRITGEVITTPFSFVATTTHSLWLNGIKPVFVDIDPVTCNLDPDKIEVAN